jgi:two-component system chemotaxis sensor kinase CheA
MANPNPIATFLLEADELLLQIEETTVDLAERGHDPEAINQLFRAIHTIKGSGAMFGFDALAGFAHHLESTLDQVREGTLEFTEKLRELILAAHDQFKEILAAGPGGELRGDEAARIIQALAALSGGETQPAHEPHAGTSNPAAAPAGWHIKFRPSPSLMSWGTDPAALLDDLRALGECQIVADTSTIPPLNELEPENCHLAWDIVLNAPASLGSIKDVFIFVEDSSDLLIEPLAPANAGSDQPAVTPAPKAPDSAQGEPHEKSPAEPAAHHKWATESTVRVPSAKLDRLVNLVGELVMNQSLLAQATAKLDAPGVAAPVEEIERLIAELRDSVLGIRMMPIGATFNRFKRLVHDLSVELGKDVDLVTEGVETELDKTVLDQLGDPLVHLIRNSVDHGLEPADERVAAGKPARGTLRLAAVHTGSNVIVSISDDGRGLNKEAIRSKAIEREMIAPDATLTEAEIFNLIFQPGFSTARVVTGVSGRGVGMDVVRRQIEALRGEVSIQSHKGKGTTISLALPLTLAIIDGLLVEIGTDHFVIPMSVVTENVELHRSDRQRNNGRNVVAVRGELVPYIRLRELFCYAGDGLATEKVVIVRQQDNRVGLVVDRVLGSHQTVIQSLGRFYRDVEVFSGTTIMGDGRAALILDLNGVVRLVERAKAVEQPKAA